MWFNSKWKSLTTETVVNPKGKFIIPPEILKQLGINDKAFLQIDVDALKREIRFKPEEGDCRGKCLL